jgi:hypothetical protein
MERKDTETLLKLSVSQKDNPVDLSESIVTEMSERENLLDAEAFQEFREAILAEPKLRYEVDLESLTSNQMIYVASVDVDQMAQEEKQLFLDQAKAEKKKNEAIIKRNEAIKSLESQAKARLLTQYIEKTKRIKINDKNNEKGLGKKLSTISKRFKEADSYLKSIVSTKKQYAKLHMGKINEKTDQEIISMSKAKKRLYIRIELCRAIKDKLPCAHYAILVSLWDRLGGSKIEYSKKNRITTPVMHGGRYFNNCLRFEENLALEIPSEAKLSSSMAISFELFLLKNRTVSFDKPVAYSYFPLINSDIQVCEGKFKTTMLKGALDLSVEKYSDMETKYRNRIDDWLCNLYFSTKLIEPPEGVQIKLPEQYEEYQFSVTGPDGLKGRWEGWKRLQYVLSEVFQDLGFKIKKANYGQLWVTLMILLLCLWMGRLEHYFGQWIYLKMYGIPINKFSVLWFTFNLGYASDLHFGTIVGLLFAGCFFSVILFLIFCFVAYQVYWRVGGFTSIGYRIGVLSGVAMIIDPFVTIIESVIICPLQGDYKRDPFLMSIYFENTSNSSIFGPIVTFLIYLVIISFCSFIVYVYLVYIHMNARILDTYNRINSLENKFMIPYDAEVGENYLRWVIKKSHRYKTTEGDTRKVAAVNYTESRKNENYSHIAIYNEGKRRSLYRHFMKLPTGAIIELSTNRLNMYADDENN